MFTSTYNKILHWAVMK